MEQVARLLEDTPIFSRFDKWALHYLAGLSERKEYKAKEWLFHEFTQREWVGIIERGEVRILRGTGDQQTCIAVLKQGGILSERLLLDDLPHSVSGFTQDGAVVVQFSRKAIEKVRKDCPDLHYRIVARVAQIVNDRLRYGSRRMVIEDTSYLERDVAVKEPESTWSILGK